MPRERRVSEKGISSFWYFCITAFILIFDQISKLFIQSLIPQDASIPIIKKIFHLTLVFNSGAAFGIFKAQSTFFVGVAIIATIFIIFYFPRLKNGEVFIKIGFALILGGILGNLIDRLRFGYVVDFLDFRIWPVFNIADSAITIGAILICIELLKLKAKN